MRAVPVGFAAGSSILWATDHDMSRTLDTIVKLGATLVRFDISWLFSEPSPNSFNWGTTDRVVDAALERGLQILGTIQYSPPWAALGGSNRHTTRPAEPARYAEFANKVADRYRGRVTRYEIWNEPNGHMFFGPEPDANVYAGMLRLAYPAIKSADPEALIIGGALGATGHAEGVITPVDFVERMYASGVQGSFDAMSFHPYDHTAPLPNGALYNSSPMRHMVDMYRLMAANGDGDKKIWITEYGAPTSWVSPDRQAQLLVESLQAWPETSFAGPFIVHTVRDGPPASADPSDHFGVVTHDFRPKPAFNRLRELISVGNPARDIEFLFEKNADPSLGKSVTPVFEIGNGHAQQFENGMLFRTPGGFFSSPPEVGNLARMMQVLPTTQFANGYQDFAIPERLRLFSQPRTGTRAVSGRMLTAWEPRLGFPVTDEYTPQGARPEKARAIDFEHGRITWSPDAGATAIFW